MRHRAGNAGIAALVSGTVLLAGCAGFSPDGGMTAVSGMVSERTGQPLVRSVTEADAAAARTAVAGMLAEPLTADTAVRIALMNNRGLQASFAELGISEADLVQAGRLRNPGISFGKMFDGAGVEIERGVMFDLVGLLTMPARVKIERSRFEQVQREAALEAVRVASRTRNAYYAALAAAETARYTEQIKSAADASAELARQMNKAGNWSKLSQVRQQAFYADAAADVVRARHAALAAREELIRLLGLEAGTQMSLPERLPDLPAEPKRMADLERQVMSYRVDVRNAEREAAELASALEPPRAQQTAAEPAERALPPAPDRRMSVIDAFLAHRDRRKVGQVPAASAPRPEAHAATPVRTGDPDRALIAGRLDLQAAEQATESLAGSLGLARVTGPVGALDGEYRSKSASGEPRASGYEVGIELPLFDWGGARTARAQALYSQAQHRTADIAVRARSEVREAYHAYRAAYDLAKHYRDEILPLRKTISDEMLLRYNGMLVSVFDLLADSREQIASVNASIEAQRDFWIADSRLQMVLTGGSDGIEPAAARKTQAVETKASH